jgi:hypothetical protein
VLQQDLSNAKGGTPAGKPLNRPDARFNANAAPFHLLHPREKLDRC